MITTETYLEGCRRLELNKKVIKRFLKEVGLYNAWKEYLFYSKSCKYKYIPNYSSIFTDDIFASSNFTDFLTRQHGLIFGSSITKLFRYFVLKDKIKHS